MDEGEVDWSDDEDIVAETEMKKAIEESLQESGTRSLSVVNPDSDGGPVQSLEAGATLANPIDLEMASGAALGRVSSAADSDGRVASYGQGSQEAVRDETSSRGSRQQKSLTTSRSSRSQNTHQTGTDAHLGTAELTHLVSNMGLTAPSRTPPPPPPTSAGLQVSAMPRNASNGSLPIPITGMASGGAARGSHDSSRHTSRQISRVDSNNSADNGGRGAQYVSSPVQMSGADHDATMRMDFSDDDNAGDNSFGVGFGAPGTRPRFHRGNTPSTLSPVAIGSEYRRGSGQLEIRGAAEIGDPDFPMTPRNDAGPFILDGSGGRA